ncbi:hypothetical protein CcI49_23690 [Frankia sp. CcI49]|uniref:hypothetical protein n=1 Tax=unclassified Frankia TaxID=2632575 RepID=UPI0006CA0ECF|nr:MULTISPECIES: hypothetical protein [unclassified Frankia]KPM57475.1 hypothetical protein ACG83_07270 [Frankia sp. R43]ONH57944.1 hypothetical protein CcI49_23690 [Frankia sp. CcI49]
MDDTSGGVRLAAEIGTGTSGALVVFVLILASAGLFVLLSKSLRRMRANVENGEFGRPRGDLTNRGEAAGDPAAGTLATAERGAEEAAAASVSAAAPAKGAKGAKEKLPRQRGRQGAAEDTGSGSA